MLAGLALLVACAAPRSVGSFDGLCGECHEGHAEAFAESRHAAAGTSDLFLALRDEADAERGLGATCDTCHRPVAGSGDGLSCVTCHAAAGNRQVSGGALIHDLEGPVRGPFDDPDPSRPHDAVQSAFLVDSELCGTCHEVALPGFVETPWQHWRDSPAAAAGVGCQDCHMSAEPGVDRGTLPPLEGRLVPWADTPVRPLSTHDFIGLAGDPDAALDLLAVPLALEATASGPDLVVTVTHTGTGHPYPDGASFLRGLWIQAGGERRWLSARLLDGGEEVVSPVLATEVVSRSLDPGEHRVERFPGAAGATACVWFEPVRADLAAHLGLEPSPPRPVACASCAGCPG